MADEYQSQAVHAVDLLDGFKVACMKDYFLDEFADSEALAVLTKDGLRVAVFPSGWVQEARTKLSFGYVPLRNVLSKKKEIEWSTGYSAVDLDFTGRELVIDMEDGKLFRYGGLRRSWSETSKIDPKRQRRYRVVASEPENIEEWLEWLEHRFDDQYV